MFTFNQFVKKGLKILGSYQKSIPSIILTLNRLPPTSLTDPGRLTWKT